jgi:hypothetical protein
VRLKFPSHDILFDLISLIRVIFGDEYKLRSTVKQWRSWLRHYATSRKVAGSIPAEVFEFLNLANPSSRTMTLESIQPLVKMSTRNLPGGKGRPARKADVTADYDPI